MFYLELYFLIANSTKPNSMAADNNNISRIPLAPNPIPVPLGFQNCPDENNNSCTNCRICVCLKLSGTCISCKHYAVLYDEMCIICYTQIIF